MPVPAVTINKVATNVGVAPPSSAGVLAIVAGSASGPVNVPSIFSRTDLALSTFGSGPLPEYGAYVIDVANVPFIACKPTQAQAATFGTIVHTGVLGTSIPSAGATLPLEHYGVVITIVAGGTIGTAGITYTYSLDSGKTTSGIQALGTSSTLTIPNSGVSFTLAAGTLLAGDTWNCFTERALATDADLPATFTALQNTRLNWEGVLIDSLLTSSTVGIVDTWLSGLEAQGIFRFALLNTRFKTEPQPATESEAAYATAMQTLTQTSTSIRCCVGADGGHVGSAITGLLLKRPTALLVGARAMNITIGRDPAYVADGPLPSVQISDQNGNPLDHDESLFPDLDNLRLMTLRSFSQGGPNGIYVTNANTIQALGSDFPYLQHIRIMNRACTVAWGLLTTQLSRGVNKNPKADPQTGAVYIFEPDAAAIESYVNGPLKSALKGEVSSVLFSLSRTDDLTQTPVTVHATVSIVAKAYVKGYAVTAEFSKVIQVAT
jgi:hypothetical protein